jgi:hypothetical protein
MAFTRYERKKTETKDKEYQSIYDWSGTPKAPKEWQTFQGVSSQPSFIAQTIADEEAKKKAELEKIQAQMRSDPFLQTTPQAQPTVGLPQTVDGKPFSISDIAPGVVESVKETYGGMTSSLMETVGGALTSIPVKEGSLADRLGFQETQEKIRETTPKIQAQIAEDIRPSAEYLESLPPTTQLIARGLGSAAVQIPGTAISPISMAGVMGLSAAGSKAKEIREADGTGLEQFLGGGFAGAAEFGTELLTGAIFNNFKYLKDIPNEGVKGAFKEMASEFIGEGATEALDPVISAAFIKDYEMPSLQEIGLSSLEAGTQGAIGAVLFGAVGAGKGAVVDKFTQNPTQENFDAVQQAVTEEIQKTNPDYVPEEIVIPKNINKMTMEEMKTELSNNNLDTTGTKAEVRARLKEFRNVEATQAPTKDLPDLPSPITLEQQQTPSIEPIQAETVGLVKPPELQAKIDKFQSDLNLKTGLKTLLDQNLIKIPEVDYIQSLNEQQLVQEVNRTLNEATEQNIDYTLAKLGELKKAGIKMNLQLFAESKLEAQAIQEVATKGEQELLKKHVKLLEEFDAKGVTKATKKEVMNLIKSKDRINMLKQKYEDKLTAQKESFKAKEQRRKESAEQTKLLKFVRAFNKQKLQPEIQKVANEIFGVFDPKAKTISKNKRVELENTLNTIEQMREQGLEVDEDLQKSVERLNRKQIGDLSADEVQDLIDFAKHLKYLNQNKNKMIRLAKGETKDFVVNDMVNRMVQQPSSKVGKTVNNEYVNNSRVWKLPRMFFGSPANTFSTMMLDVGRGDLNSMAYQTAMDIENAQDKEFALRERMQKAINNKVGDYVKLFNSAQWRELQDVNGAKLTSGEKVYLKYALNDKNVKESLNEKGGKKANQIKPTKYTDDFLQSIELNQDEQNVYDALPMFFELGYLTLNPEHVKLKGYELKRSGPKGKYIPKIVSKTQIKEDIGASVRDSLIKNTGSTKERTGAKNVLLIPDIADVITNSIDINSKYGAYAVLNDDLSRLFNDSRLQTTLRKNYGLETDKTAKTEGKSLPEIMVSDLMKDLQGTKTITKGQSEGLLSKIRSNAAQAILAYRKSTPLMQTASYPLASTVLSPQSLAKGLVTNHGGYSKAAEYNQRARVRAEEGIDRELSGNTKKFVELGMKPIKFMDKLTVGKLWNATVEEVMTNNPNLTEEQAYKEAGKLFNRVLDTQPNYTTANRSMTMRSKSELDKALTMFSSAKSSMLNELKRGYIQSKYTGNNTQLKKALAAYVVSAAQMALIGVGVGALDDKDKDIKNEFVKRLTSSLPGLDLLSSLINGYDIDVVSIESINDMASAFGSVVDLVEKKATGSEVTQKQMIDKFWNMVDATSQVMGVPVENIRNDIMSITNLTPAKYDVKQVTDPMYYTEFYDRAEKLANDGNIDELMLLLNQIENVGVKKENFIKNMKKRLDEDTYNNIIRGLDF